jgi:hypothetical protein
MTPGKMYDAAAAAAKATAEKSESSAPMGQTAKSEAPVSSKNNTYGNVVTLITTVR